MPRAQAATRRTQDAGPPHGRRSVLLDGVSPSSDVALQSESLLEEAPHLGREVEYEAVIAYVSRRWLMESNTSLFVCGGCGCGKTSTVKRALRAMSARVLPCDAQTRSIVKRSTLEERGWIAEGIEKNFAAVTPSIQAADWPLPFASSKCAGCTASMSASVAAESHSCTPRNSLHETADGRTSSEVNGLTPSASSTAAVFSHTSSPDTLHFDGTPVWGAEATRGSTVLQPPPVSPRASASSGSSTASNFAAGSAARGKKRGRDGDHTEEEEEFDNSLTSEAGAISPVPQRRWRRLSSGERRASLEKTHTAPIDLTPYSFAYFHRRYPEVFAGTARAPSSATSRHLFGHYVNCADVGGSQLVEAIFESVRATYARADSPTCVLLQQLARIGQTGSGRGDGLAMKIPRSFQVGAAAARRECTPSLHVVALDEVEYVRGNGAKTLAHLAELAFQHPTQLAFIFISNQRAFLHVPQMMLEPLLFQPYSETQLKYIGISVITSELQRREELLRVGHRRLRASSISATSSSSRTNRRGKGSCAATTQKETSVTSVEGPLLHAANIDIKPRLYDYIAKKALLEFSGDVRQVIAMCHRVVAAAWKEVSEARPSISSTSAMTEMTSREAMATSLGVPPRGAVHDLPTNLEAVVTSYGGVNDTDLPTSVPLSRTSGSSTPGAASGRTSTRSSCSSPAAIISLTSATASPTPTPALALSGVMTVAKSVHLLRSNQVESDIDKHVGTLPEQTLYVLSCIVVLTLRKQEERERALTSVGGRMGTSRTAGAGQSAAQRAVPTLALKMHEVHQLYTRLMAKLHFPSMRAEGFPLQVECLADFGVLTRPQLRGTDRVFSLNGTWTLPAMHSALVKRGDSIRKDRVLSGAEVMMENRFEEVLRELTELVK